MVKPVVVLPHQPIQFGFTGVAARRVPHVMHQSQNLHQIRVKAQHLRHRTADLRHFQRVRQAIAEMVGIAPGEDLRFVFQAPESSRVNDAVAVAFVIVAIRMRWFEIAPPLRRFHSHGVGSELAGMLAEHS